MYDLTGFQRDLLYTIAGKEEPHGLAIKEELEEYYEKEIHHGRLYPNLDDASTRSARSESREPTGRGLSRCSEYRHRRRSPHEPQFPHSLEPIQIESERRRAGPSSAR